MGELRYGLTEDAIARIKAVFAACPEIDRVVLYGSRAKGTQRNGSDIDLTIEGEAMSPSQLLRLENALDDLLLPYKMDISLLRQIDNPDLLAHIRRVGLVFYEKKVKQSA
jgi:predicted nucleotidyltransferase